MTINSTLSIISGWIFGLLFSAIGIINMGWGNDPVFGLFIFLFSLIYYPFTGYYIRHLTGITIPLWAKVLLGLFILWASLGVGELFDKIKMMQSVVPGRYEMIEPSPLGYFHVTQIRATEATAIMEA